MFLLHLLSQNQPQLVTFSHQHMIFDGYAKQTSLLFLRATQEEVMQQLTFKAKIQVV
jgi:hypothetical protein